MNPLFSYYSNSALRVSVRLASVVFNAECSGRHFATASFKSVTHVLSQFYTLNTTYSTNRIVKSSLLVGEETHQYSATKIVEISPLFVKLNASETRGG